MKPIQNRVARILKRCETALTPGQLAALAEVVEHELKCQDRDTRHACAEAATFAMNDSEENKILSGFGPEAKMALYRLSGIVLNTCINTRAI